MPGPAKYATQNSKTGLSCAQTSGELDGANISFCLSVSDPAVTLNCPSYLLVSVTGKTRSWIKSKKQIFFFCLSFRL